MALLVTKRNGGKEPYDEQKVLASIRRSTSDEEVVSRVMDGLRPILRQGITTDQIYEKIAQLLKEHDEKYEYKFRLREALGKLNDERFEFEKFVQNLFSEEGYDAQWQPAKVQGYCIEHQIDVSLPQERILIECKHHRNETRMTGLGDVLETWARLYDIKEGFKKGVKDAIDMRDFWLVVNTKFSEHAKKYARCKHMTLIGWGTDVRSIQKMMERTKCYPITILPITEDEHNRLGESGIVSTKSFHNLYRIRDPALFKLLPENRLSELHTICEQL